MNGELGNAIAGPSTERATNSGLVIPAPTVATTLPHVSTNASTGSQAPFQLFLPPPGVSLFLKWHRQISCFSLSQLLCLCLVFTDATSWMIAPPPPKQYLASTQDLLSRLQLFPAYDKHVRLQGLDESLNPNTQNNGITPNPMSPHIDKGKGREVLVRGGDVDMHDPNDGDEDDTGGKGEKKKRNNYKHLIRGIPGELLINLVDLCAVSVDVGSCLILTRETLDQKG